MHLTVFRSRTRTFSDSKWFFLHSKVKNLFLEYKRCTKFPKLCKQILVEQDAVKKSRKVAKFDSDFASFNFDPESFGGPASNKVVAESLFGRASEGLLL